MFYIVATPIGNSKDISFRAVEILKKVDFILCEDTRITGKLIAELNITSHLLKLNDHNEDSMIKKVVSLLEEGKDIALVSDAGMPLINDPGFALVRDIIKSKHPVTSIPGPSSILTALQLSGISTNEFCFLGYFPRKANKQIEFIKKIKKIGMTAIFFESPKRIINTLNVLKESINENNEIAIARELTKKHESLYRGTLNQIDNLITIPKNEIKGEFTITIKILAKPEEIDLGLQKDLLSFLNKGDAAKVLSKLYKLPKREIYKKFPK